MILHFTIFTLYLSLSESHKPETHRFFEPKILGGHDVDVNRYPHAAQFMNLGGMCAATILSSRTLLTAAHCFMVNDNIFYMNIFVGTSYLNDDNAANYNVYDYECHENYNKKIPFENDIAIIFTTEYIKFLPYVKKGIIVSSNRFLSPNSGVFIAIGWGWTKMNGKKSSHLLETHLKFVTKEECENLHHTKFSVEAFCLYGGGQNDTCRGDSGSGVLWKGQVAGIVSHGDGCGQKDKPSIYTNVHYHIGWIKQMYNKLESAYCNDKSTNKSLYYKC